MFLPSPFTPDEIFQFVLTYLGDASFCNAMMHSLSISRCFTTTRSAIIRPTNNINNDGRIFLHCRRRNVLFTCFAVVVSLLLTLFTFPRLRGGEGLMRLRSNSNRSSNSFISDFNMHSAHNDNAVIKRKLNASSTAERTRSTIINSNNGSSRQTVVAIGVSNDIMTYKLFIGSLRHVGFKGTIILGRPSTHTWNTDNNTQNASKNHHHQKQAYDEINNYLKSQNNIITYFIDIVQGEECNHHLLLKDEQNQYRQPTTCIKPYTNVKLGWTGHLLARDWLKQCPSHICSGPVLLSPLTNVYFQSNPFRSLLYNSKDKDVFLHLYEDHPNKTINNNFALQQCKKFMWDVPYIKSFVLADRLSMSFYLEHMVMEIYNWMDKSECYLSNTGIAIQNYLFYNGIIHANSVFQHREDLVNSVGEIADEIMDSLNYDDSKDWVDDISIQLRQKGKYVDENGYFLNLDGLPSPIVHQINGFGKPLQKWLYKQPFMGKGQDGLTLNTSAALLRRSKYTKNEEIDFYVGEEDSPMNNPLFYLSLEASYVDLSSEMKFLRKRKVMSRVVLKE